MVNKDFQYFTR